jgi:hypothetical protein
MSTVNIQGNETAPRATESDSAPRDFVRSRVQGKGTFWGSHCSDGNHPQHIMSSDKPVLPSAEPAATAVTENVAAKAPAAAKALPEQNPAFKAMGMFDLK